MPAIAHVVSLTSPLFLLAGLGYAPVRWFGWPKETTPIVLGLIAGG